MGDSANKIQPRSSVKIDIKEDVEELNEDISSMGTEWRNVIFIPFHPYWQSLICMTTIVNGLTNSMLYTFFYRDSDNSIITMAYYCFELLYMADIILIILHTCFKTYRRRRHYNSIPVPIILIDIVSVLPYNELIIFVTVDREDKDFVGLREFWLKGFLRVVRLLYYYRLLRKQAGLNQVLIISITTFIQFICITLFATFWFNWVPRHYKGNHWYKFLQDHDTSFTSFDNFTMSYTTMGNIYGHNWTGVIRGENPIERAIVALVMLIGYLWHVMIFSGQLTAAILHQLRKQFRYSDRLKHIKFVLKDWSIKRLWREKTLLYYGELWSRRHGILKWPKAFKLLPPCLQKETTVDIFWEALRHSHLFVNLDMAFKRELTLMMRSDFLLADDYLFREGEIKSKMVFIVSGVIQILSDEDNESPILSLSSGTILSEISCIMPVKALANYRAATYCDLQSISLADLTRVLVKYPDRHRCLRGLVADRLMSARNMRAYLVSRRRRDIYNYDLDEYDTPTKRFKRNWREMLSRSVGKRKQAHDEKFLSKYTDPTFNSTNLDLIVLSDNVELKVQAICIQGRCPYVLDPDSSFSKFFSYLCLLTFVIQALWYPYFIAYKRAITENEFAFMIILDVFNFLDLYLQLITAIRQNNRIIREPGKIAIMHLKKFMFIVDVLATFPFDYFARKFELGASNQLQTLLRAPRVIRCYRIFTLIKVKEVHLTTDPLVIRYIKYSMIYSLGVYLISSIMYVLTCYHEVCISSGWLLRNQQLLNYSSSRSLAFERSIIYSFSILTGVGHSDSYPFNIEDMWSYHATVILGYFIFSFCLAELTAVVVYQHDARYRYTENFHLIKQFMITNRIKEELKRKALDFFHFQWLFNEGVEAIGTKGILSDSPEIIKREIIQNRIVRCLKKVKIFSECSSAIFKELIRRSNLKVLPAGSKICVAGSNSMFLNIVIRGFCEQTSILPKDVDTNRIKVITVGDTFPLLGVLHRVPVFVNVRALTAVEILYISQRDFLALMRRHVNVFQGVFETIRWHRERHEQMLLRKTAELGLSHTYGETKAKCTTSVKTQKTRFFYEMPKGDNNSQEKERYQEEFQKIGFWGFLRFILIKEGINPNGKFYFYYEIFRCCFSMYVYCYAMLYSNVLIDKKVFRIAMPHIFRVFAVLDMYIRSHCHYYNYFGVLVTHPLWTAKHYFQTAFLLDIYGSFPLSALSVDIAFFPPEYLTIGTAVCIIITRPVLMYRPILALHHLAARYDGTIAHWLSILKLITVLLTILGLYVNVLYIISCYEGFSENKICADNNWMRAQHLQLESVEDYMLASMYMIITMFSTAFSGITPAKEQRHSTLILGLMVSLIMLRFFTMAYISGSGVGMDAKLTEYRNRLKNFLAFVKSENVEDKIIKEVCEHYQYLWERGSGTTEMNILSKYDNELVLDLCEFMFSKTVRYSQFFQGIDSDFIRTLGTSFQLIHYKKDAYIIRTNDIQGKLYFVSKGIVEIKVMDMNICTLEIGGMFGCFSKRGETRQTISAFAKVHVDLLIIDSALFHELAADNKVLDSRAKNAAILNLEYFTSMSIVKTTAKGEIDNDSMSSKESRSSGTKKNRLSVDKIYLKINKYINQESIWFTSMDYFIYVHLAPGSCVLYLVWFYVVVKDLHLQLKVFEKVIMNVVDVIFICRIILEYFLQYDDLETGVKIVDQKKIRKRYVSSLNFWLDIFSSLPIEYALAFASVEDIHIRISTLNRVLRFFYLVRHYYRQKSKLNISHHLRWTYLLYITTFQIVFLSTLWRLLACPGLVCPYLLHASHDDNQGVTNEFFDSLSLIFAYTVNIFTATGMRYMPPLTRSTMALSTLMAVFAQFTISLLLSGFVSVLVVDNFTMSRYEQKIDDLKTFLQDRELSPEIFKSVWHHVTQLWYSYQGENIPQLVITAPKYLQEDLFQCLYGAHLSNHFLFLNTHIDFLRQLIVHLRRTVYFPGYAIVETGDIDESMYIINKGEVQMAVKCDHSQDIHLSVLHTGQTFGEAQGLYNVPHRATYRAITVVEILSLKRSDWKYLMRWFPASQEEINLRAREHNLLNVPPPSILMKRSSAITNSVVVDI